MTSSPTSDGRAGHHVERLCAATVDLAGAWAHPPSTTTDASAHQPPSLRHIMAALIGPRGNHWVSAPAQRFSRPRSTVSSVVDPRTAAALPRSHVTWSRLKASVISP